MKRLLDTAHDSSAEHLGVRHFVARLSTGDSVERSREAGARRTSSG